MLHSLQGMRPPEISCGVWEKRNSKIEKGKEKSHLGNWLQLVFPIGNWLQLVIPRISAGRKESPKSPVLAELLEMSENDKFICELGLHLWCRDSPYEMQKVHFSELISQQDIWGTVFVVWKRKSENFIQTKYHDTTLRGCGENDPQSSPFHHKEWRKLRCNISTTRASRDTTLTTCETLCSGFHTTQNCMS